MFRWPNPKAAPRRAPFVAVLAGLLALAGCSDSGTDPSGSTVAQGPFRAAATCGGCHPQHFAEWKTSMHSFGGVDPVMVAAAELARSEAGKAAGDACTDCHAPSLKRQNDWLATLPPNADPLVEDVTLDGISCDVCHSIDLIPPPGDISFLPDVDPTGPKLGGIQDPVANPFHTSRADNSFRTSVQCGSCHQIHLENGTGVENTFREWENSIFSGMGRHCQDCHMPAYTGQAAVDGPTDRTVHRHRFVGVDYATEPYRGIDVAAQQAEIETLLQSSVMVTPDVPNAVTAGDPLTLHFPVTNSRVGHSIPSGTSFAREMWLRLEVRDASGALVYRSGWLEGADSLLTTSDPDLVSFGSRLLDKNGAPTFFLWRAENIDESRLLRHGDTRPADYTFDVPAGTAGPLTVNAALRFRPFAPQQLEELGLQRLMPIRIFTMWEPDVPYSVTVN